MFKYIRRNRSSVSINIIPHHGIHMTQNSTDKPSQKMALAIKKKKCITYLTYPRPEDTNVYKDKHVNCSIFLSLKVITTENGDILTDIYYKATNTHDYLSYDSHHPQHVKDNIPYVLAKKHYCIHVR